MDIRNLPSGAAPKTGAVRRTGPDASTGADAAAPAAPAEGGDRVELSAGARARSAAPAAELDEARALLRSEPPFDQATLDALRQRVADGVYSQPSVLDRVAERLTQTLGDAPPE